ncbi:MAG: GerMN domain-containing protein [Lachnospiraceae bacterium]|nr:GerMN domain-containing protein [Lachnospiraceae bacterium]
MSNKRLLLCIVAAVLFMLSAAGCKSDETERSGGFKIYRANVNYDALVWEYAENLITDGSLSTEAPDIDTILRLLASTPVTNGCYRLIPEQVAVNSWSFGQDGQLVIDFNSVYNSMDTVGELLCRAGIVKTLCQLENVEYVEFLVDQKPLSLPGGMVVRLMTAQDFIDNTGTDTLFAQSVNITIYFANETGNEMSESLLRVEYDGQRTLEEIVLYELIEGPLEAQTDLFPVMPEETAVNKVYSKDGICYVDFNSKFLNKREEVTEDVTVYSVVNSLVEISYITKVSLSVDGSPLKSYGSLSTSGVLGRRPELITIEKAGDITE